MKIADLYRQLCAIYEPNDIPDIEDYLIASPDFGDTMSAGNRIPNRETLYIRESEEGIEIGLFISPPIIAIVKSGNVLEHPDEFSCAIEGVSHFLYIADRAAKGMRVSKLELELQGEVDKFLLMHIIASGKKGGVAPELFERQFERHNFDPSLGPGDIERYETASHFAAKYCAYLRSMYFNPLRLKGLVQNARDFFERDMARKIERLIP